MTSLRLDRLELKNYRCFGSCEVVLHPNLTVLVAENGQGKTALLDAASLALSAFVSALLPTEPVPRFRQADVRLVPEPGKAMRPVLSTRVSVSGVVADQEISWAREISTFSKNVRSSTRELRTLNDAARQLVSSTKEPNQKADALPLPLIAFYGTGRLWSEQRVAQARRTSVTNVTERLAGYSGCFATSSSFKDVSAWYEARTRELASPAYSESLATNIALVTAVREAAKTVLQPTGWSNLDWDAELKALVADHPQAGRLPLSSLSDGIRNMLALVADVARRCASLNPYLGGDAARQTPGVLLIDEVDMHLHPRWQQAVIELLRSAFPSLQLLVTTHSPHVLSTVYADSIRVLRVIDGEIVAVTPRVQTRGVMSADVLASIMGVDPVPQVAEAAWVIEYRTLIEDGQAASSRGKELRQKLNQHFGDSHLIIADCDRLIRFQAFRVKKSSGEAQ